MTQHTQPTEPITLHISTRWRRSYGRFYMCLPELRRVLGLPTLAGGCYTLTVYPNPDGILHYCPTFGVVRNVELDESEAVIAVRELNRALGQPYHTITADIEIEGYFYDE